MTVEQLMEELYRLIYDTQTINPMAKIKLEIDEWHEDECPNCGHVNDGKFRGDFNNIEIEMYDTTYRELIIQAK